MKQPYYQIDFSGLLCKFEIKVNDIEILSMNLDGQASTNIPVNVAIFDSGLQKIEVKGYPLDGTKIMHPEAYIRYKVVEHEVSSGRFVFVKDFEKHQTPTVKEELPFIFHTSKFLADVPYILQEWNTLQNIKDLKVDIKPALTIAYQKLIREAKMGNYQPLIDTVRIIEARNGKTMYLSESDRDQRVQGILDDIDNGFEIMDLTEDSVLSYAGNGKLVRFIRSNGNASLALENNKTSEELILDFWFCLPNGSQEFVAF